MAGQTKMKANELVVVLAGLLNLDVENLARVGNLPVENLRSWLAGKRDNLRLSSIVSLLALLGLDVSSGVIRLASDRVHFWTVRDSTFARSRRAYTALTSVSKLLAGCSITRVEVKQRGFRERMTRARYLLSGSGIRVVISVEKSALKAACIGPEIIKGACWRDDSDDHVIPASQEFWGRLLQRDLTTFEFDRAFNQVADTATWSDVSLIAREFGISPSDVAGWIAERFGEATRPQADEASGMDLHGSGGALRLLLGGQDVDRFAA